MFAYAVVERISEYLISVDLMSTYSGHTSCLFGPFPLHPTLLSLPVSLICVHLFHSKKSWRIQAREDSNEDPSLLVDTSEHMFAFLYVPFSAGG